MIVIRTLKHLLIDDPSILTIGTFDGIHLGHRKIFEKMLEIGKNKKKVAICFSRSPEIFFSKKKEQNLIHLEHKLMLLEKYLDIVVLLDFTKEIASLSYFEFLKILKSRIIFTHLVLGEDAAIGNQKKGKKNQIKHLEKSFNFQSIYIPILKKENTIISSSKIKQLINEGKIKKASRLLGWSFQSPFS